MATPSRDPTASVHAHAEPPLRGRVVYIEDDETNVLLVQALVARHPGVEMLHAATGRDGIELVRREQARLRAARHEPARHLGPRGGARAQYRHHLARPAA